MTFDPNQPRNKDGEWTEAGNAARQAAGLSDFKTFVKNESELKGVMLNPFDRNTVSYLTPDGSDVMANVQYMDYGKGQVEFNITVPDYNRGKGFATTVLKGIMERTRKAGITLTGTPEAFGYGKKMSNAKLWKWYKSLGFIKTDNGMEWK